MLTNPSRSGIALPNHQETILNVMGNYKDLYDQRGYLVSAPINGVLSNYNYSVTHWIKKSCSMFDDRLEWHASLLVHDVALYSIS